MYLWACIVRTYANQNHGFSCIYLCTLASNPMKVSIAYWECIDAAKADSQCMEVDRLLEGYLMIAPAYSFRKPPKCPWRHSEGVVTIYV